MLGGFVQNLTSLRGVPRTRLAQGSCHWSRRLDSVSPLSNSICLLQQNGNKVSPQSNAPTRANPHESLSEKTSGEEGLLLHASVPPNEEVTKAREGRLRGWSAPAPGRGPQPFPPPESQCAATSLIVLVPGLL